jgi:hypothetical protein
MRLETEAEENTDRKLSQSNSQNGNSKDETLQAYTDLYCTCSDRRRDYVRLRRILFLSSASPILHSSFPLILLILFFSRPFSSPPHSALSVGRNPS